ncbi:MAG: DUF3261 domain-containing protein [Pseudomonadota bacterium]
MSRGLIAGCVIGRRGRIPGARRSAAVLAGALLSACAALPPPPAAAPSLLPPASLGASHSVEQVLHAAHGAREATLQCIVDIVPERLRVVCVSALGQRVFTLEQTAAELHAERAPFAPRQLAPQHILADLQLAYWPLAALQAAVADGVRVLEPRAGLRRLQRGERIVAEVHYADADPWNGRLWLVNLEHGYSLDIRSRPLAEAAQ